MPLLYPAFGTFISPSSTPPEEMGPPQQADSVDQFEYIVFLIATPPPVLVVYLKRFQQIAKMHLISFTHRFEKLDDYVTFPEYLDLTPFSAPRKEDYGLGRRKDRVDGEKEGKGEDRCMYRLYVVVVHGGNMVRPFLSFLRINMG